MAYNSEKAKTLKQLYNNARKEKKTVHLNILLTESMNKDIQEYLQKNNMSFNEFINKLIKKNIY